MDEKSKHLGVERRAPPMMLPHVVVVTAVFNLNKIIIDTVYDVICAVYPVTGSDRDFARCACTQSPGNHS